MIHELLNALRRLPQPQLLRFHHRAAMIFLGLSLSLFIAWSIRILVSDRHYILLVIFVIPLAILATASGRVVKRGVIGKSMPPSQKPS
jgi:hypothetical protein